MDSISTAIEELLRDDEDAEGISIDDEALYLSSKKTKKIVLISGFESFNVRLYKKVSKSLKKRYPSVTLCVFSDRDIVGKRRVELERALDDADAFFGSLLFDYDQVEWLREKLERRKHNECRMEMGFCLSNIA